jgi:hypothetical protein
MSKPAPPDQPLITREPSEQVIHFADLLRGNTNPESLARVTVRAQQLQLQFTEHELIILGALDTPARVQGFLDNEIYYNNDHAFPGQNETAFSPRRVLQTGMAHCFEGAMFAYAVNFLHGHSPKMVLLEAQQDSDHNLVLFQDPETKSYGCNAHSAFPNLDGRLAQYSTVRALAESYYPYYYSDRTFNLADLTLVGYSDPFDLVARFGTSWIDSEEALWDIYFTYIDDSLRFHNLFDDSNQTHIYPLLAALKNEWIEVDARGRSFLNTGNLPRDAREWWDAFWGTFGEKDSRPRGDALEIEKKFFAITKITPLDLREYNEDLQRFLDRGYRVEQILTRR